MPACLSAWRTGTGSLLENAGAAGSENARTNTQYETACKGWGREGWGKAATGSLSNLRETMLDFDHAVGKCSYWARIRRYSDTTCPARTLASMTPMLVRFLQRADPFPIDQ